jgi:endonuclease/exonuclease/phosphatase family metal-dependent hydrolase
MKTKIFLVALFVTFFYGAWYFDSQRRSRRPQTAHDGSFNFSLFSWNVGYFDFEADSRARSEDLGHIARVIGETGADCVALQEVAEPGQVDNLSRLLYEQYPHHYLGKGLRTDRYVAILSRQPFQEETRIRTSVGRDAIAVTLRGQGTPKVFTIVNCHADAFNSRRRRYFVSDLVEWHRRSARRNVIMVGDFNFDLVPIETSDLFTDDKKNDGESYSLILEDFRDVGRGGGPTASFERRIDYVFVSAQDLEPAEFRVLHGKLAGKMDHHPLLARFRVKER